MLSVLKTINPFWLLLPAMIWMAGCRKYAEGPATIGGKPAYLRVFNVIPNTQTPFNSSAANPFFTFLFDPKPDASGTPSGATIVGDWLGTRQTYTTSYPLNEGNSLGASLDTFVTHNITYEYPGSAHVLTAPPINGFDLSAWAQVPSGKHRVQFVTRPQTDTPFANLSAAIRKSVVIDTTIDLQPGEVYTLEAVALDEDNNKYGVYLRQEQFTHQSFSDSNLYVGFFNLSGKRSTIQQNDFPDSMKVTCTYRISDDVANNNAPAGVSSPYYKVVAGMDNIFLTNLTQRMATTVTYLPLPLLPTRYFFDDQGVFRNYGTIDNASNYGTLPSLSFVFTNLGSASAPGAPSNHTVDCILDPALANNYPSYGLISSPYYLSWNEAVPNLNLFSTGTGAPQVYPCLTIFDIAYGVLYMTRIQPAFYKQTN